MRIEERKAAISAYKERKAIAGIYRVRCLASGQAWVGHAPDLGTIRNRVWFMLRHGVHRDAPLQAAWIAHGEAQFTFDELELLDEDQLAAGRERVLKACCAHWCAELGAAPL